MNTKSLQFFLLIFSMLNVWSYNWCSENIEEPNVESKYSLSEMPTNVIKEVRSYLPRRVKETLGKTSKTMRQYDISRIITEEYILAPDLAPNGLTPFNQNDIDIQKLKNNKVIQKLNIDFKNYLDQQNSSLIINCDFELPDAQFCSLLQQTRHGTQYPLGTIMFYPWTKKNAVENAKNALAYAQEHKIEKIKLLGLNLSYAQTTQEKAVADLIEVLKISKYKGIVVLGDNDDSIIALAIRHDLLTVTDLEDFLKRTPLYIKLRNRSGETLLHLKRFLYANDPIYAKKLSRIVPLLVSYGIDINAIDFMGNTAVYYATKQGISEYLRALLDNGANPNLKNRYGRTSLYAVVNFIKDIVYDRAGRDLTGAIEILLSHGANPNIQDNQGETALHCYCELLEENQTLEQEIYFAIICSLLEHGADATIRDNNGQTAFELIRDTQKERTTDKATLRLAIEALAQGDIGDKSTRYGNAVAFLTRIGDYAKIKILLDRGANPQMALYEFYPQLKNEKYNDNFRRLFANLIEHGANLNRKDNQGRTPLHYYANKLEKKLPEDREEREQRGRTLSQFSFDHYNGQGRFDADYLFICIQLLLEQGADPDIKDNDGKTFIDLITYPAAKVIIRNLIATQRGEGMGKKTFNWIKSYMGY